MQYEIKSFDCICSALGWVNGGHTVVGVVNEELARSAYGFDLLSISAMIGGIKGRQLEGGKRSIYFNVYGVAAGEPVLVQMAALYDRSCAIEGFWALRKIFTVVEFHRKRAA